MHHLQPRRLIDGYYIIEIEQNSYTFERRHGQTDRHRHNKTKAGECEMCFPTCTESRSAPYASCSKAMKTLPQAPAPIPTIRNASPSTFPSKLRSSATLSSPNPATCTAFLATSWFREPLLLVRTPSSAIYLSLSLSLAATNEYKSVCAHCRYIQIGINPAREEEGSAA
jgi:hypothetical protein